MNCEGHTQKPTSDVSDTKLILKLKRVVVLKTVLLNKIVFSVLTRGTEVGSRKGGEEGERERGRCYLKSGKRVLWYGKKQTQKRARRVTDLTGDPGRSLGLF